MRTLFLLFATTFALAACAPADELDPSIAGEPDDPLLDAPEDDGTEYLTLSAGAAPTIRRCVTATTDARTGHTWRYRTDEFTAHDGMVRVWIERTERNGATTHFGSRILHANPSVTHRWDANLSARDPGALTLWLGRRGNAATIGVAHRSIDLFARGANGWCSERTAPTCGEDGAFFCSPFSGTCECAPVQDPIEYTTESGRSAQIVMIGGVGMSYGAALTVAASAAAGDFVLPIGDAVAVVVIVYASYQMLVIQSDEQWRRDGARTAREIAAETGGRMLSADDAIRPVPDYDNDFPAGREASGAAMLDAMSDALAPARNSYRCREENHMRNQWRSELLWTSLRSLLMTARNRGGSLRSTVEASLRAFEELLGTAEAPCAEADQAFAQAALRVLCRFYIILASVPGGNPGGQVATARTSLESVFNRQRYQCR